MVLWRVTTAPLLNLLNIRLTRITLFTLIWFSTREISIRTNGITEGPVVCPIRLTTGIPCPACGTTRSIAAITEGNFDEALRFNPLGFAVIFLALLWALKPTNLNTRFKQLSVELNTKFSQLATKSKVALVSALYLAAWIVNLFRIDSATF